MNRIPPNLFYLTIYNPTLRPTVLVDGDNEDAEEQAHILFYTSKERAVSRDRMLRQIGLAKALVNFTELFNTDDPCSNVHSQSRRLIMVSPEPNFWIHACIEVARTLKVDHGKGKSKSKSKPIDKGKEKDLSALYEYDDASVHDNALHAHILKGYERFKLTHGSFTSILANLGKQALELQLERFFTVWAWSWNLEDGHEFGESFGPLLHPYSSHLIPLLDEFSAKLSANMISVVLTPPYIVPSTRYTDRSYPGSLAVHLIGMVPPHVESLRTRDALNSSVDTLKCRVTPGHNLNRKDLGESITGMPTVGVNMDTRTWSWPGYLTFGKGNGSKGGPDKSAIPASEKEKTISEQMISHVEVEVNASALEDAISSDSLSISRSLIHSEGQGEAQHETTSNSSNGDDSSTSSSSPVITTWSAPDVDSLPPSLPSPPSLPFLMTRLHDLPTSPSSPVTTAGSEPDVDGLPPAALSPPPLAEFSMTRLHLAPLHSPTSTSPVTIHYFIRNQVMLVLIKNEENAAENYDVEGDDLEAAAKDVLSLFDEVDSKIYDANQKSLSESLPSATKILQPQDRYIISKGQYTNISPGFSSKSNHLFNAMVTLSSGSDITEVFSRGQNPQHWHIGKRLRRAGSDGEESIKNGDETIFLEVFRKETSLTDVDNVLAGIVRKSSESCS